MGVLTGFIFLVLLRLFQFILDRSSPPSTKEVAQILTGAAAIPGIMFGGSWMSNAVLGLQGVEYFPQCYTAGSLVIFMAVIIFPFSSVIWKFRRQASR